MAVLLNSALTLTDWANRLDPKGKVPKIVEALSQSNEVLEDMLWVEGNLPTGHKHTVRTGLPAVTWRKLYGGVMPSKSTTVAVTDTTGMLEAYSEPDKKLADLNGNTKEFRASEAVAFLEAMSQELASTLFYGNTDVEPEKFMGLAPRFNDLSAANSQNIIDAGGTGSDNTSIWLVGWGENRTFGLFPKGSKAGLTHTDKGQVTVQKADGSRYEAYQDHFEQNPGLAVSDWRYVVRIANIDVSDLSKDASTGADLFDFLAMALEQIHSIDGRTVFYGNRKISSFLRRQQKNVNNVNITMNDAAGRKVMHIDEVPFKRCDAILNTEARVT